MNWLIEQRVVERKAAEKGGGRGAMDLVYAEEEKWLFAAVFPRWKMNIRAGEEGSISKESEAMDQRQPATGCPALLPTVLGQLANLWPID